MSVPKPKATAATRRAAQIKRQNAWFASLTKPEKRVAIARDVLAQLKSGRLQPEHGAWLFSKVLAHDEFGPAAVTMFSTTLAPNADLQGEILAMETCTGCALGGLFMCTLERSNNLTPKQLVDENLHSENIVPYLEKYFSRAQLQLIEASFENGNSAIESPRDKKIRQQAREWDIAVTGCLESLADESTESARTRMRLIMENIVVNNGTFKPKLLPVMGVRRRGLLLPAKVLVTPGFTR